MKVESTHSCFPALSLYNDKLLVPHRLMPVNVVPLDPKDLPVRYRGTMIIRTLLFHNNYRFHANVL